MRIFVTEHGVDLVEPEDFTRFHVESELSPREIDTALRASYAGNMNGAEALVALDFIRSDAGPPSSDDQWISGFQAMISYAKTRGWLTEDGLHLLAHIAPPSRGTDD